MMTPTMFFALLLVMLKVASKPLSAFLSHRNFVSIPCVPIAFGAKLSRVQKSGKGGQSSINRKYGLSVLACLIVNSLHPELLVGTFSLGGGVGSCAWVVLHTDYRTRLAQILGHLPVPMVQI